MSLIHCWIGPKGLNPPGEIWGLNASPSFRTMAGGRSELFPKSVTTYDPLQIKNLCPTPWGTIDIPLLSP